MLAHVLVYRDASRRVAGSELRRELLSRVASSEQNPAALSREQRSGLLALALIAGELETALDDRAAELAPLARATARAFTDACADAWWRGADWDRSGWQRRLELLALPEVLGLKRPEGYAYYALDPAAYARAALLLAPSSGSALVVGIRSIGASLSAFACAALRERGLAVERITVRPWGHPWDRQSSFDAPELRGARASQGPCFVVDEGPGLSGSTFLAVGEALELAGVARERITFITSHEAAADRLVARDAARRWSRFRAHAALDPPPFEGALDAGAGRWRELVYASNAEWPGCWTSAERSKFRAPDGGDLLKFVGLPPYGDAPSARAERLAHAGFSPSARSERPGWLRQRWCPGPVLDHRALAARLDIFLPRLLDYLTFRAEACAAPEADLGPLLEMARCNVAEALGEELPGGYRLEARRWVFPDARLAPHEWVGCGETWLKVDAVDHGDDHFFPGPCDSAWDLAGAIVELGLSSSGVGVLLDRYRRLTGDDATSRLPAYLVAYTAQRVGAFTMALLSADPAERPRLERELELHRAQLRRLVARMHASY